jgi:hypothetical protein
VSTDIINRETGELLDYEPVSPVELEMLIRTISDRLEAAVPVRSDSEWVVDYQVGETMRFITVLDSHNGGHDGSIVAADVTSEARAQLIVTLHRTIDVQLEILRLGIAFAAPDALNDTAPLAALALADAILGSDS